MSLPSFQPLAQRKRTRRAFRAQKSRIFRLLVVDVSIQEHTSGTAPALNYAWAYAAVVQLGVKLRSVTSAFRNPDRSLRGGGVVARCSPGASWFG